MHIKFMNRKDAGQKLAALLLDYQDEQDAIVLALLPDGLPVATEIATKLNLPMDVMLLRALSTPENKKLAMGSITIGDIQMINDDIVEVLAISEADITAAISKESKKLLRQNMMYRNGRPGPDIKGRVVILVDDGMETGANMRTAVMAARRLLASHVVVAVPVASEAAHAFLGLIADDVITLQVPKPFHGVAECYQDFSETSDADIHALLKRKELVQTS